MIPTLQTPRLLLNAFTLADAPAVREYAGDIAVARTTANIPHPYPEGAAEGWIGSHQQAFLEDRNLVFAIRFPDGKLAGAINLAINRSHLHGELGYWIARPFWGRGIATEAARSVVAHGFTQLGLERIHARHLGNNPASGRVMEKAGLTKEGCQRRHFIKNGQFEDVLEYGILKAEYGP